MRSANYLNVTTTSIAGTSGDGAVTFTTLSSRPTFSTVMASAKRWVRYVIEDTVNYKFETGLGTVTSDVLTRTRPQVTWDGTTYKDGNSGSVTALQFGSSPTSGDVIIRLSPTSEAISPINLNARQSSIAGDSTWRDYPISAHISWNNGGAGQALTNAREYWQLYLNVTPGLLSGIQFDVTTGVSGNIKIELWDVGSNGLPGAKIVAFNTTSTTSTAVKTDTTTGTWSPSGGVWLTPGWYYIGFIADNTCSIRAGAQSSAYNLHRTPLGRKGTYGDCYLAYKAGTYASGLVGPPDTLMNTSAGGLEFAWFGLKIVP